MAKILLVEDETELAKPISNWLADQGHVVEVVHDGSEAMAYLKLHQFDVVILDLMLPGMSGLEICRQYRARGGKARVLMLTARKTVDDKERGLDAGADDYLEKPFHLKELAARIRALLRRSAAISGEVLQAGDVKLDTVKRKVWRVTAEIALSPKEFALLEFFMRHPQQYFSADAIIDRIWRSDTEITPDTIRMHVKSLRRKIDTPGQASVIHTLHGVGYKLDCDV